MNKFGNQLISLELLHCLHEQNYLKKHMLSTYLLITKDHRRNLLKFIGLPYSVCIDLELKELVVWLQLVKIPPSREG